ncbi:AI-2E family transporter [Undibacterium sp. Jales W-56]|uniref:AI-2E family transporter n=1 Tax=Undibacterium sp. Jales W-56 TaxID=2897325 RepID=UPI0021D06059|nr:AI-2E family transporter [Undibacterium sp. Jales W-56]MCU6433876.1 AI-2E family transporter [Undibacterium sp. Jales W-56]
MNISPQEDTAQETPEAPENAQIAHPAHSILSTKGPNIHIPVNARGLALGILATVAFVFALQSAQHFFIPLIFSILISYTLNPVVVWLEHIKIPRAAGASLVMLTILCGTALVANSLRTEFNSILVRLPDAAHQISQAITKTQDDQPSTIQQMQAVASEIEKATSQTSAARPTARQPTTVIVARPAFKVQDWLWAGSMGAAGALGQFMMVIFLVFFLLLSGDSFKRKLVKITGPSLSSKKITVHILDDINKSIQSYMFMLLVTNLLLALLLWIVFRLVGLENAGAWAVAAGCLHIIPYFGPVLITLAVGATAFMQFGSLSQTLLVAGSSLAATVLVGTFITTWMTGKIAKMNAAAVFISLLFWGWLWGIWGLLLGVPIIVAIRVVSERIDGLQSVAELLSE